MLGCFTLTSKRRCDYNEFTRRPTRWCCAPAAPACEAASGTPVSDRGPIMRPTWTRAILPALLALPLGLALAQNPNEKEIKPAPNAQDKDEIYDKDGNPKPGSKLWVLDFK